VAAFFCCDSIDTIRAAFARASASAASSFAWFAASCDRVAFTCASIARSRLRLVTSCVARIVNSIETPAMTAMAATAIASHTIARRICDA
jgi:hypothetical protein